MRIYPFIFTIGCCLNKRILGVLAAVLFCLILIYSCGGNGSGGGSSSGGPAASPVGATQSVEAKAGGTITTPNGLSLRIPAGALPQDETISVIPLDVSSGNDLYLMGVRFEPEGMPLLKPAVVRFPLPADWDGQQGLLVWEFRGNDPSRAAPTGIFATITGSPGAYWAEATVYHFSGPVLSRNCFSGMLKTIMKNFQDRGCNRERMLQKVRDRFPGIDINENSCASATAEQAQAFLDTYFEDVGGWNPGEDVPQDVLNLILQYARNGRQVALGFNPIPWGPRTGPLQFYRTDKYAHVAVLEVDDKGVVQIRNTQPSRDQDLLRVMNGEITYRYPAEKINEFRNLQEHVALEIYLCGSPGCLSKVELNQWKINPFNPLDGFKKSDLPFWERWSSNLPDNWKTEPRPVPWPAIRIYVEKSGGAPNNPCEDQEGYMEAEIAIPGYYSIHATMPSAWVGLGNINEEVGYPSVYGTTQSERLLVMLSKVLSGPGTYTGFDITEGGNADLFFDTALIRHQTFLTLPVAFHAVSGTVVLDYYGKSPGDRLKGTFDVVIEGQQEICDNAGCTEYHHKAIAGTMRGSFDGFLKDATQPPF